MTGQVVLEAAGRQVEITHPDKVVFPSHSDAGPYSKLDLVRYYLSVADGALRGVAGRPMILKRFVKGIAQEAVFQKRAPEKRPDWVDVAELRYASGTSAKEAVIRDAAGLAWVINLGCIDLNPWYARCDANDRPDYLHFDLDPVKGAGLEEVRQTALVLRDALDGLKMPSYPKSTGSRGIHVYVPIVRGPTQKEVWGVSKAIAQALAIARPGLITAEYRIAKRPLGRVLVDYNQNAWGRTLASVYSVRPRPRAPVSAPVTWREVERGFQIDDFRVDNMAARVAKQGDLWKPLLARTGRFRLERLR